MDSLKYIKNRKTERKPNKGSKRNKEQQTAMLEQKSDTDEAESSSVNAQPIEITKNQNQDIVPDTRSEIYSRRLYRQLMSGYDLDADSDTEVFDCASSAVVYDNWRQEYVYGTQELAKPNDLPCIIVKDDNFYLKPREIFKATDKLIACNQNVDYYDAHTHENGYTRDSIHYDINAQDLKWLERINEDRKLTTGLEYLNSSQFVEIIQALEEDTFLSIHNHLLDALHVIYTRSSGEDDIDHECDVCRISECDVADEMVYCDNCNTCVHMLCAGLNFLPAGEWTCEKCKHSKTPAPPCILCPTLGGSMTYNHAKTVWAHHSCALFIPEVLFVDEEHRAPMTNFDAIASERYNQLCAICDTKIGVCVTCSEPSCEETYHVCCALRAGCTIRIQEVPGDPEENVIRVTYCHRHSSPNLRIEEEYRACSNPWLAKLESVFYLLTSYEKLADRMGIEEIVVSDVYEYWKQKRIERGSALISHLRDFIKVAPTIDRVANKIADDVDILMNRAGVSSGILPAASSRRSIIFFRPATLMITELRQLCLKRVGDAMKHDMKTSKMLMERESLKHNMTKVDIQQFHLCRTICNIDFGEIKTILCHRALPKNEFKKAQTLENYKMFLDQLSNLADTNSTVQEKIVPLKRKLSQSDQPDQHQSCSTIKKISEIGAITLPKSPLRPRNQHPRASLVRQSSQVSSSPTEAQNAPIVHNTRHKKLRTLYNETIITG